MQYEKHPLPPSVLSTHTCIHAHTSRR